jgi:cytochrome c peroxidase
VKRPGWHRRGCAAALWLLVTAAAAPQVMAAAAAPMLLDFSPDEVALIASHGPWPPAPHRDASNRVDGQPAAIAFGRSLFLDRALSADGTLVARVAGHTRRVSQVVLRGDVLYSASWDGRARAWGLAAAAAPAAELAARARATWGIGMDEALAGAGL